MDLTLIGGDNFSGRTARLRDWAGLPPAAHTRASAYIGLDPTEAFSGLTPSVATELELAAADVAAFAQAREALEALGFGYVLDQNPFSLSGGEQVIAAVIAATAARPERLAIDGALEQLAPDARAGLLDYLRRLDGNALIADNRLFEWGMTDVEWPVAGPDAPRLRPEIGSRPSGDGIEIEIVDLSFAYKRGRPVFHQFSARFEAGRAYLLQGRNGSGKTTLSKLLSGLLRPQAGEIRIDGRPVQPWKSAGRFASYHFQNPNYQLFGRTVRQELGQDEQDEQDEQDHQAHLRFGLGDNLERHPLDLPYVLRKRLAIASAALRPPAFLILDEPTLGQDDRAASAIRCMFADRGGLRISHSQVFQDHSCVSLDNVRGRGAAA